MPGQLRYLWMHLSSSTPALRPLGPSSSGGVLTRALGTVSTSLGVGAGTTHSWVLHTTCDLLTVPCASSCVRSIHQHTTKPKRET